MPVAEHHYYQRDLFQQAERLVGLPDLTEEEANALCNLGTLRDRIEEHKRKARELHELRDEVREASLKVLGPRLRQFMRPCHQRRWDAGTLHVSGDTWGDMG